MTPVFSSITTRAGRSGSIELGQRLNVERHFALDDAAAGDPAAGRHAAQDRFSGTRGGKAADGDLALGHDIDFAIGAEHRGHQQGAALQAGGIAQRGNGDVDFGTLAREGRQIGGDHHRGDVVGLQIHVAGVDAETLQHADQALSGEHAFAAVLDLVAGAVEADHQAVADQLVLAHALEIGDVLDPRGRRGRRLGGQDDGDRQGRGRQQRRAAGGQPANRGPGVLAEMGNDRRGHFWSFD
jgi:hypothetical protein